MNSAENRIWFHENSGHVETPPCAAGLAIGFSERSPDKLTDNEDAAGLFVVSPECVVLAVADGMGGTNCGDRASQTVITAIGEQIHNVDQPENIRGAILDAIESSNEQILGWGIGAGSTLAVAVFSAGNMRAFHVGDAAVLLCSNRGTIKYSTVAHGPVAMAVEIGVMDESEAMHHVDRNLISNCIGSREMRIEIGPSLVMSRHDTLMVGSDGLFDNLMMQEIVELIRARDLPKRAGQLLQAARNRMQAIDTTHPTKPDDLTVLMFRQRK